MDRIDFVPTNEGTLKPIKRKLKIVENHMYALRKLYGNVVANIKKFINEGENVHTDTHSIRFKQEPIEKGKRAEQLGLPVKKAGLACGSYHPIATQAMSGAVVEGFEQFPRRLSSPPT